MLAHALDILRLLSESPHPLSATEISQKVGLHTSNISRTLRVLIDAGYVRKPSYHSFAPDLGLLALAGSAARHHPLCIHSAAAIKSPSTQLKLQTSLAGLFHETYRRILRPNCCRRWARWCLRAIAAARGGLKTCLVHERPVLGGVASSEMRVTVHGAAHHQSYARESGIIGEMLSEERARNHEPINENGWTNSAFDMVLYDFCTREQNLSLHLNTPVTQILLAEVHTEPPFWRDPQTVKDYTIQFESKDGWHTALQVNDNYQRQRKHLLPQAITTRRLRILVTATNGDPVACVYEIRCYS